MSSHWKAVFGVILIFVLGFASGVVSSSIFVHKKMVEFLKHPGQALMAAMEHRLTRNLALTEDQKEQIHGYFRDNLRQHKLLQSQIQPQVSELNSSTVKQIRAALNPGQQAIFDKNLDELKNRFWQYATSQDTPPPSTAPAPPASASTNTAPAPAPQ